MEDSNVDMSKMMEQAMSMSKILGLDTADVSSNNKDSMESMLNMMNMMQLLNTNKNSDSDIQVNTAEEHNFYDDFMLTPNLKAIKSAIPFLEIKHQKQLSIMIKVIEIQKLQKYYEHIEKDNSFCIDENWQYKMLQAMQPHIDKSTGNNISMVLKMMDMKVIMKTFEALNKN